MRCLVFREEKFPLLQIMEMLVEDAQLTYAALKFHLHWTQNLMVILGSETCAIPRGFGSPVVDDMVLSASTYPMVRMAGNVSTIFRNENGWCSGGRWRLFETCKVMLASRRKDAEDVAC